MVKDSTMFGNQTLEWSYEYCQLQDAPQLANDATLKILTNV